MFNRLSLTARLSLSYTLVSISVLLGLGMVVETSISHHFVELDEEYLKDKISLVRDVIQSPKAGSAIPEHLDDMLGSHRGLHVQLWQGKNRLYASTPLPLPSRLLSETTPNASSIQWEKDGNDYRAICQEASLPDKEAAHLRICAAVETHLHSHFMETFKQTLALYVFLASLLSCALCWWVARNGLSPLRAMKAKAQQVTANRLDALMPVEAVPMEMSELAHSLNAMLLRLQQDFKRLSDFSSDIAHELRTPISNLLTETQVAISQSRSADDYRDTLASNAEELQRLARTVADMLFLAKTEHGLVLPHREKIALAEEVAALFDFYEVLAEEKSIAMTLNGDATLLGDRLMLRRAISNLLSNAIRHTPPGKSIKVDIASENDSAILTISNEGQTIPPDVVPRLFDRFYRADQSRAHHETDGAGLGLAITRSIVEIHGGTVKASSIDGLTRFTLTFPSP